VLAPARRRTGRCWPSCCRCRRRPLTISPAHAPGKKEKTFEPLLRQLEAFARQRPVLMLFEDVHWIDPARPKLLDLLVERVAAPAGAGSGHFPPGVSTPVEWPSASHGLVLNRSTGARRHRWSGVVGAGALPGDVVAEIVKRTDGVALSSRR